MLVYVATYPRCGNALLRDLIRENWLYLTANGYGPNPPPDHPALARFIPLNRPRLPGHALEYLTDDNRERTAAAPEWYFVKTHELPFAKYFPGENVIQSVRHPGAAIFSHWRMKQQSAPDATLEQFIQGQRFGSWSAYHKAWRNASAPLLRFRFEDILADQERAVRALAEFLGFDVPEKIERSSLEAATARNPLRNPGHGVGGWLKHLSFDERRAVWEAHGEEAVRFGYLPTGAD